GRGQRTLERLLEAGAAVFAARGYHAARVDDIVKAAETSHGTFYLYFSSKEDLFHALAVDVAESMVHLARELPDLAPHGGGLDGDGLADDAYRDLHEWLGRFRELYAKHSAVIRSWTEAEIVDSEMGKVGGDLVAQFSQELATRLKVAAPELDPGIAALAFVGMIERSNYYLETRQVRVEADEMVATLARVLHAGIFGAAAREDHLRRPTAGGPERARPRSSAARPRLYS
ncbi:MAG: helix-turn-helix domain-containing protein, partial [Acidimicrobiia bacterium]